MTLGLRFENFTLARVAGIACGLLGVLLIMATDRAGDHRNGALGYLGGRNTGAVFDRQRLCRPAPATGERRHGARRRHVDHGSTWLLVHTLATGQFYLPKLSFGAIEVAIGLQIVVSGLGYLLFFEIIRLAGPVFFSQIGYLATISGMTFAIIVHGEAYSSWIWGAVVLILFGLILVNARKDAQPEQASITKRR